jgi:hypothetical protein
LINPNIKTCTFKLLYLYLQIKNNAKGDKGVFA